MSDESISNGGEPAPAPRMSREAAIQRVMLKRRQWQQLDAHIAGRDTPLDEDEQLHSILARAVLGRSEVDAKRLVPLLSTRERRMFAQRFGAMEALKDGRTEDVIAFAVALAAADPSSRDEAQDLLDRAKRANEREIALQAGLIKRRLWNEAEARLAARPLPLCPGERLNALLVAAALGKGTIDPAEIAGLITSPEQRLLVRQLGCYEALRTGRLHDAISFADALLQFDRSDQDAAALMARARVLIAHHTDDDRRNVRIASTILRAIRAGQIEKAMQLSRQHLDACGRSARLAQVVLMACERAEDDTESARVLKAIKPEIVTGELAVHMHRRLMRLNRPLESLALCRPLLDSNPLPRLYLAVAEALKATNASSDETLPLILKAIELAPNDIGILRLTGELLLSNGRYTTAVKALARAVEQAPKARNLRLLYIRALRHSSDFEAAANEVMRYKADFGPSANFNKVATGILLLSGREKEGAALYAEDIAERGRRFGDRSFLEHLETLKREENLPRLPQARLDWAWGLASRALGHAPSSNRKDWERRARWGYAADLAMLDWIECRPERLGEVQALIDTPAAQMERARRELGPGKGLLFASAHVGPMYAGPLAMYGFGLPFRVVSSVPRVSTARFADQLISTVDASEVYVLRKIISTLQEGKVVIVAVDGSMNPATPRLTWEGAQITYSPILPALALRLNIPTVFTQPYWDNGRIRIVSQELPTVSDGGSSADFAARWQEAYFAQIRRFFTLGPENLRLSGGLWRNISPFEAGEMGKTTGAASIDPSMVAEGNHV